MLPARWAPPAIVVRLDVPGVSREALRLVVVGHELHLSGERRVTPEDGHSAVRYRDRIEGFFERRISFRFLIDPNRVKVSLEDGVLEIIVAKPAGGALGRFPGETRVSR